MSPSNNELKCIVCDRLNERSIVISGFRLCLECEQSIASIHVEEPAYNPLVQRLRHFWGGLAEAAASGE